MAVVITKLNTIFRIFNIDTHSVESGDHHWPTADKPALKTNETMRIKPMPKITPNDNMRSLNNATMPLIFLRSGTHQIRSSEFCNSPNTVVAPTSNNTKPIMVAIKPSCGLFTFSIKACTATAPCSPIKWLSWPEISPRAASTPKANPAIESTISSMGAIENKV